MGQTQGTANAGKNTPAQQATNKTNGTTVPNSEKKMPTLEEVKQACGDHMIFSNDMKGVKLDDFELLKVIGKGQFAKVYEFF